MPIIHETTYSTPNAAEILGISYRGLDDLSRRGIISPAEGGSRGRGRGRRWSFCDLLAARIGFDGVRAGISWLAVKKLCRYVQTDALKNLETHPFVAVSGDRVWAAEPGAKFFGGPAAQVLIIDLRPGIEKLNAAIDARQEEVLP